MKTFRKFMVHNYVGERWIKIPFTNTYSSSVRPGPLNMATLFFLVGVPVLLGLPATITGTLGILVGLWILWTGFPLPGNIHYFGLFPAKWEEMKDIQKWTYGRYILSSDSPKELELTIEQFDEFVILALHFKSKFNLK